MARFDLSAFERDRGCDNEVESVGNRNRNNNHNNNMVMGAEDKRNCHNNDMVMGAEDRNNDCGDVAGVGDSRRVREECIVALKVYDSCRQQDCLDPSIIGPARAAEDVCFCGQNIKEGDVINPPNDAAAVTIDRLKVKKIIIVDKRPNELRRGFWDIDLKYVFTYRLTFREANGTVIGSIRANSIFNKQVTLFGSVGADLVIATDLLKSSCGENETVEGDPFVLVEAKAVALSAVLGYQRQVNIGRQDLSPEPVVVNVTIGLFTIIKLFRIVNLTVQSRGFCIPEECEEVSPTNACEFFDNLDFPLDAFAPPQRPEFLVGISNDIPRNHGKGGCGCGCN